MVFINPIFAGAGESKNESDQQNTTTSLLKGGVRNENVSSDHSLSTGKMILHTQNDLL